MARRELPYDFDLLYDIKMMYQVEAIANGEPHCSDAGPEDLVTLFIQHELPIPSCLEGVFPWQEIWVEQNGTWLPYAPPVEEAYKFRKTKIRAFKIK